jgi:putative ABC transport system substrate-binding protein
MLEPTTNAMPYRSIIYTLREVHVMHQSRHLAVMLCIFIALLLAGFAHAQQLEKVPRIGYLTAGDPGPNAPRLKAFRQGLHELGYVEGKTIVIEVRYGERKFDRIPALAAELVRLHVDVIVTGGGIDTRAAKGATNTIPIVMAQDPDPIVSGVAASLARPGGNITGLSAMAPEIAGKRLEILKTILPELSRVAVFGVSRNPINAAALREVERAAKASGVTLQFVDVDIKNIEQAFRVANEGRAEVSLILPGPFRSIRKQILALAMQYRLPMIYDRPAFAKDGGLIAYGTDLAELHRRAATYVDQILKGAKPADLPVQQPTKFEMVINLKTAKALGVTIPPTLLFQATEVIQ